MITTYQTAQNLTTRKLSVIHCNLPTTQRPEIPVNEDIGKRVISLKFGLGMRYIAEATTGCTIL